MSSFVKKKHFLSRYSYASILKNESHCLSWFPKVRPTFLCSSFSLVASVCFPRFSTRFRNHLPASSAFSCWPKYVRASLMIIAFLSLNLLFPFFAVHVEITKNNKKIVFVCLHVLNTFVTCDNIEGS